MVVLLRKISLKKFFFLSPLSGLGAFLFLLHVSQNTHVYSGPRHSRPSCLKKQGPSEIVGAKTFLCNPFLQSQGDRFTLGWVCERKGVSVLL